MKRNISAWKRIIAAICILSVAVCASIAFIPHSHECVDSECYACTLIENSRNTLLVATVICAIALLNIFDFIIANMHAQILSYRDATLVGLKVKLSN